MSTVKKIIMNVQFPPKLRNFIRQALAKIRWRAFKIRIYGQEVYIIFKLILHLLSQNPVLLYFL